MPVQTQNFERHLANIARGYASMVTRLAKGYSESSRIRRTIRSRTENKGPAYYRIIVQAGDGQPQSSSSTPDVRAREYGSGIWARRGPRGKILIKPRNYPALIFPWEKANPNIPRTKKGHVILKQVEHPGIDADNDGRGYLGPAMNDTRKAMREKLKKEGAMAIRADLRASFRTRA